MNLSLRGGGARFRRERCTARGACGSRWRRSKAGGASHDAGEVWESWLLPGAPVRRVDVGRELVEPPARRASAGERAITDHSLSTGQSPQAVSSTPRNETCHGTAVRASAGILPVFLFHGRDVGLLQLRERHPERLIREVILSAKYVKYVKRGKYILSANTRLQD